MGCTESTENVIESGVVFGCFGSDEIGESLGLQGTCIL